MNGHKDIENRGWFADYTGPLLIHAGKGMTRDEYMAAVLFMEGIPTAPQLPDFEKLQRGGIVGRVEMYGCCNRSDSPWFVGEYGFLMKQAQVLEFRPCVGKLGFFRTPQIQIEEKEAKLL